MFYGGGHLADNRGHCDLWRQQQKYYVKDHWGQYWGRFCCIRSMKAWKSDPACEAKYNAAKTKKKHGQSSKILCSSYIFSHPLRSLLCLLNTTCSSAQSPEPLGNYHHYFYFYLKNFVKLIYSCSIFCLILTWLKKNSWNSISYN